tara:strand:+ start:74 stop:178 length:105 start_codon:yes stop_codon:yes gene_type:complete
MPSHYGHKKDKKMKKTKNAVAMKSKSPLKIKKKK